MPNKKNTSKSKLIKTKILLVNRCIVLNKSGHILLVKRSPKDVYEPEKWEFPGGKLEEGQDISNALEREVLEETGIMVLPLSRIAYVESMINTSGKYKGYTYVALIGIAKHTYGSVVLSDEHTEYVWVTEKEALKMDLRVEVRKALIVLQKTIKNILKNKKNVKK